MSHEEIEEVCEGKTIKMLTTNLHGVIIRFTDGSKVTIIEGVMLYEEDGR